VDAPPVPAERRACLPGGYGVSKPAPADSKSLFERQGLKAMHRLDPERAHGLAIWSLKKGVAPGKGAKLDPMLTTSLFGLTLPSPIGVAAGFDKNAEAPDAMLERGWGFVEVGAATPRPQRAATSTRSGSSSSSCSNANGTCRRRSWCAAPRATATAAWSRSRAAARAARASRWCTSRAPTPPGASPASRATAAPCATSPTSKPTRAAACRTCSTRPGRTPSSARSSPPTSPHRSSATSTA